LIDINQEKYTVNAHSGKFSCGECEKAIILHPEIIKTVLMTVVIVLNKLLIKEDYYLKRRLL
jgi:hypothetical protein